MRLSTIAILTGTTLVVAQDPAVISGAIYSLSLGNAVLPKTGDFYQGILSSAQSGLTDFLTGYTGTQYSSLIAAYESQLIAFGGTVPASATASLLPSTGTGALASATASLLPSSTTGSTITSMASNLSSAASSASSAASSRASSVSAGVSSALSSASSAARSSASSASSSASAGGADQVVAGGLGAVGAAVLGFAALL